MTTEGLAKPREPLNGEVAFAEFKVADLLAGGSHFCGEADQ